MGRDGNTFMLGVCPLKHLVTAYLQVKNLTEDSLALPCSCGLAFCLAQLVLKTV